MLCAMTYYSFMIWYKYQMQVRIFRQFINFYFKSFLFTTWCSLRAPINPDLGFIRLNEGDSTPYQKFFHSHYPNTKSLVKYARSCSFHRNTTTIGGNNRFITIWHFNLCDWVELVYGTEPMRMLGEGGVYKE